MVCKEAQAQANIAENERRHAGRSIRFRDFSEVDVLDQFAYATFLANECHIIASTVKGWAEEGSDGNKRVFSDILQMFRDKAFETLSFGVDKEKNKRARHH